MTAQEHPPDLELLAFAAGTLDEAQHAGIAAHVSGCARCRVFVRAMEHVGGVVLDDLPPAPLAGGTLAEVLARLPAAPSANTAVSRPAAVSHPPGSVARRALGDWRRVTTYRHLKKPLAAAALVVLAVGITYLAGKYTFFRDTDDYAASTATTGRVAIGGATAGNIEKAGDADWFRVLLTEGTTYRFRLEGSDTAQGTLQYPVLRLLDWSGRELHSDAGSVDGPGPGWTSVLSYTASSTAAHYLSSEASGDDQGTYRISATVLSER